jgi:hypothetical protein
MKVILFIAVGLSCAYLILGWAIDNPMDAKKITKQVDTTANTLIDKSQRAVEQIKR